MRLFFAPNVGPRAGISAFASVSVPNDVVAIRAEAVKRLCLKKKEASSARLFVWSRVPGRGGIELLQECMVDGLVWNDDLIAVSLGEAYAGPASTGTTMHGRWVHWEARRKWEGD